jgi:hypothetical protein
MVATSAKEALPRLAATLVVFLPQLGVEGARVGCPVALLQDGSGDD